MVWKFTHKSYLKGCSPTGMIKDRYVFLNFTHGGYLKNLFEHVATYYRLNNSNPPESMNFRNIFISNNFKFRTF